MTAGRGGWREARRRMVEWREGCEGQERRGEGKGGGGGDRRLDAWGPGGGELTSDGVICSQSCDHAFTLT